MIESPLASCPSIPVSPDPSLACIPWDDSNPDEIQAIAEDLVLRRMEELPNIIGIVRDSEVPPNETIGYPAYTPLNFYDNLADETNPDSFLDMLDLTEVRGGRPGASGGPNWTMWRLPGHGNSREKYQCGKFLISKTYGCPEGHEIHAVRCSCNRLDCPVCWTDKVRRNADHIQRRLNVVHQLYNGPQWHHVVVSPPQESAIIQWGTAEGYKESKNECLAVLKKVGVLGGVMVCHPYRQNDGSLQWRAGPHFHAIVNGRVNWTKVPPGWIVKNVRSLDISEVFPVAYYLCSHAGVGFGGVNKNGQQMSIKSVSYFGNCGTNNGNAPGKLREETSVSVMRCSTCDMGQYRYRDYIGMLRGWLDYVPPLDVKQKTVAWCIRSDIDELRGSTVKYDGKKISVLELDMGLLNLPEYLGSRVFIEYPEAVRELTSEDVQLIDGETAIETQRRPSVRGPSSGRSRQDPEAVGVSVGSEFANVSSSPGPGGGGKRGFSGVAGHV